MSTVTQQSGIEVLDKPVTDEAKAAYVREMFDDIAHRYDLLNSVLSAGIHKGWRGFATRCAGLEPGNSVLDLCSGTGEWTPSLRRAVGTSGLVMAADFSLPMLQFGDHRFRHETAQEVQADAMTLPFAGDSFHGVTIGFGIRNVADRDQAFREMFRVLKPGGRVVCLEFSQPPAGLFRTGYEMHSRYVMPKVGGAISGRPDAYAYLPASVARFDSREALAARMRGAGFSPVRFVDLTFGLVCVHVGVKPSGL